MKKYFVVNNQEDEDGCVFYPANAINNKAEKNDPEAGYSGSKENKKVASGKMYYPGKTPFPIGAKRSNER
ncbi:MAG: hypothetical protein JJE22_20620 [Bacteroidia bacterium]|nr:hypothetical protein [Bacteroidia bacterium]